MSKKNLLTAVQIKNAKCVQDKKSLRLNDGGGLILIVHPSQKKVWQLRIKGLNGKEVLLTLGPFKCINLKEARELRDKLIKERRKSKEPKYVLNKLFRKDEMKVSELVAEFLEEKRATWKKSTYNGEFNRAKKYLIDSSFGAIPVAALTEEHVYDLAKKMDQKGYKTQHKKLLSIIKGAFSYGKLRYGIDKLDLSDISHFLIKHKSKAHASIEIEEIPSINALISASDCSLQTKLLWDYVFLTGLRVQEASQNTWENVNFDDMTVTVPAEISKNGREHIIPISTQTLRILKLAKVISHESPYIFPSPRVNLNKPISKGALGKLLRSLGLKGRMSAHGARSTFSGEMHEQLDIADSVIIEMILSHTDTDRIRQIYNRTKFLNKRRDVLDHWGNMYEAITKDCSCTDVVENELIRLKLLPPRKVTQILQAHTFR
ncbi:tyrosine-type recombinase/integrase [Vibrio parahaemolyticus]|nr:tyrosine-type recombinase/integrase [Vibrio parahaemolyticus]